MSSPADQVRPGALAQFPLLETPSRDGAGGGTLCAVVVGTGRDIPSVLEQVRPEHLRLRVAAAVVVPEPAPDASPDQPELLPEDEIARVVHACGANAVLVAGSPGRRMLHALGELTVTLGCRLLILAPPAVPAQLASTVVTHYGFPIIELAPPRLVQWSAMVKRVGELLIASVALLTMLPLLGLLALAIRLESAGHPLFGHERVGLGGRRFRCWKLRTMYADAETRLETEAALRAAYEANDFRLPEALDSRITRLGRWLRRSSMDELPQLWNVVRGDMSLVGPRPLVADELVHFRGAVLELLSIRPGITGAWAVNGRHALPYPRRAEVELAYVRGWSLWGDVGIVWRTVRAVLNPGRIH